MAWTGHSGLRSVRRCPRLGPGSSTPQSRRTEPYAYGFSFEPTPILFGSACPAHANSNFVTVQQAFQGLQATRSNPHSPSYSRYFQPDDFCNVRTVLEAILGLPGGIGPTVMAEILKVVYERSINPDDDDNCALHPDEGSYFGRKR